MSTVIDELVVELQLDGTFARNEADKIKRDTEKAAKEAAESGAEEAANSFAYLTGCDIRNYKSSDIQDDNGDIRSDV